MLATRPSIYSMGQELLHAIRTLKIIEACNREATQEEKDILARFPGFGAVALQIFCNPVTKKYSSRGWQALGEELQALLTPEEYASARRTIGTAYYTPQVLVAWMYQVLARMGLPVDALMIEPGMGSGRFLAAAPPQMHFCGVELDGLSARIAKALYPQHDIRHANIRDVTLPSACGVIGNVPFAQTTYEWQGTRYSLHEYCLLKCLDAVRPGGILALVISHHFLDRQNATLRHQISQHAELVSAIRLPSGALEGTDVVGDLLFMKKRREFIALIDAAEYWWTKVSPHVIDGADIWLNHHFLLNHERILGVLSRDNRLYGSQSGYSVTPTGDLPTQLAAVLPSLPRDVYAVAGISAPTHAPAATPLPPLSSHCSEGSFYISESSALCQIQHGAGVPVCHGTKPLYATGRGLLEQRLAALLGLRDAARAVLRAQNEGQSAAEREASRTALNTAYDAFVARFGCVNKTVISAKKDGSLVRRLPNLALFRDDPDCVLVLALEEYDEESDTATKAAIMRQDVVGHLPPVTASASAEEALLQSLNTHGSVNLPFMAQLYGHASQQMLEELGDLLYHDPATDSWETADVYLSGNVRTKLVQATEAGDGSQRNVAALAQVQPPDILPSEIEAHLGAPWVPVEDVQAFAVALFQARPEWLTIRHLPQDALWTIEGTWRLETSVAVRSDYGTARINGAVLLEQALNNKMPTIYDTRYNSDNTTYRVVNQDETVAAREKQKRIKEAFRAWLWTDQARTERLVRVYNDMFNCIRLRAFDGGHLDFPGMNPAVTLTPQQKDAVWRIMSSGNSLMAQTMGFGKTFCLAAAAMKMRQTGLIRKALVAVPNHLLEQFGREFLHLYPNAKLLMASREDFTRERRKLLTARMASQVWDAILVTHSSFERIAMSREFQQQFLTEQVEQHRALVLDYMEQHDTWHAKHRQVGGRSLLKSLEAQLERLEAKLQDLMASEKKDDGLVFDELGVDHVFIDECFPYDTLIETSKGFLKIGDIVENRLKIQVKSMNSSTYMIEYKPVTNWFANKRHTPLVEVHHERGSFICTANHKVWVDGCGYKMAASLSPKDMCLVSKNVHLQEPWTGKFTQAHTPLLQQQMQGPCPGSESGDSSSVACCHARNMDEFSSQGQAIPAQGTSQSGFFSTPQNRQPYVQSRNQAQSFRVSTSPWTQAARGLWIWPTSSTGAGIPGIARYDGVGVSHCDNNNSPSYRESSDVLQSRPRRPPEETCCGGRREESSSTETSHQRCEKRQSLSPTRVVSVTILKPGSDGEYHFGGRSHSIVYDLEVEGNHNYFANGILVSNCQAFKNLTAPTKMERIAGIQTSGSQRAFDLFMKTHYLDSQNPNHGLTFATGTPISNSMIEIYTLQRYLDRSGLRERGVEHFDAWAATFGEVVDCMEISPDGRTLRARSSFARFLNVPELMQHFRSFADVKTAAQLTLPRPALQGGKAQTIACPMSAVQRELQDALVERYEAIRSGKVKPWEDNALAVTTDGRKLALSPRLLLPAAEDFPASKINACIDTVYAIWEATAAARSTQLIFSDFGVHPNAWGYSAYDEVMDKLVKRGIPATQIAAAGEADTDAKKHVLFEKVRAGSVRVLLGSTQKMGMGMNVQRLLIALHHLDAPWKPAEVEQREGRIVRQGNSHPEVQIYRYVTEGSFDAFMWQTLETKATFIGQLMTGELVVREAEDVNDQALSYAEVKAIASGNPAMLVLAETDAELKRLNIIRKGHLDQQFLARRALATLPDKIAQHTHRLYGLAADALTMAQVATEPLWVIVGQPATEQEAREHVAATLITLAPQVTETRTVPLGHYRGLTASLRQYPIYAPEVLLVGRVERRGSLAQHAGHIALLNALERLAGSMDSEQTQVRRELAVAEAELADYAVRAEQPFPHEAHLAALTQWRGLLAQALAADTTQTTVTETPPLEEIVATIKGLRATQTVEAVPARLVEETKAALTEAITTRIMRNQAAILEMSTETTVGTHTPEQDTAPGAAPSGLPAPPAPQSRQSRRRAVLEQAGQLRLF